VSNVKVCQTSTRHPSSNELGTTSFNSRVAKYDDSYSNPFELKISQIISKLQSDYVVYDEYVSSL
jgi:hypothetical protein